MKITGCCIRPTTHVNGMMRSLLRLLVLWNLIGCLQAHTDTPDGRKMCFAWNSPTEQCAGGCGRAHVCRICFGAHPAHMHASVNRRAEPAAGGAAEGSGAAPGQTF
jgi:hypothetical protein